MGESEEGEDKLPIQIWRHTSGLLKEEVELSFLDEDVTLSLVYINPNTLRLILAPKKMEINESLYLEINYNPETFKNLFQEYEAEWLPEHLRPKENEILIKNLHPIPGSYVDNLEKAIFELEEVLKENGYFTFEAFLKRDIFMGFLLEVKDLGEKQILWIMKQNPPKQCFQLNARTLYNVVGNYIYIYIVAKKACKITRDVNYTYAEISNEYGLQVSDLMSWELGLLFKLYMDRTILEIDSDVATADPTKYDPHEDIFIKTEKNIEISFFRKAVGKNYRMPLSLAMFGYGGNILGVKVGAFSVKRRTEQGLLFMIDHEQWSLSKKEIESLPKKKLYMKDPYRDNSYLPHKMKMKGYDLIYDAINKLFDLQGWEMRVQFPSKYGNLYTPPFSYILNKKIK